MDREKSALRRQMKQRWAALGESELWRSSQGICSQVLALPEYQQANLLFCFVGVGQEVATRLLIEAAWAAGKQVAVPRCLNKELMAAYRLRTWNQLGVGCHGLLEPELDCPLVDPKTIDFGVVPCLACDLQGYRLGKGGGYYDRYLANCTFPTAAVCPQALLCSALPHEIHDIPMKMVVTPEGVYRTEQKTKINLAKIKSLK